MRYAIIKEGTVTNIIHIAPHNAPEFPGAVAAESVGVIIGDSYDGESFLRNGEKLLTELQRLSLELHEARAALELIYSGKTEVAQ